MQSSNATDIWDLRSAIDAYNIRTIDIKASYLALEKLAANGSKASLLYISYLFMYGVDLDGVAERAKRWNAIAKEVHLGEASYYLGCGFHNYKDFSSMLDAFSWGANEGYAPSINRLGNMHLLGIGVQKNPRKALMLYKQAAAKGNVYARKNLAHTLIVEDFGFRGKVQGFIVFCSLFYYQFELLWKVIRNIPRDERYYP